MTLVLQAARAEPNADPVLTRSGKVHAQLDDMVWSMPRAAVWTNFCGSENIFNTFRVSTKIYCRSKPLQKDFARDKNTSVGANVNFAYSSPSPGQHY